MILPSREIEPVITRCWADPDQVITDDAAQTIASWWHSPAAIDEQVTRLSHGLEFDARGLLTRVDTLIRDTSADAGRHPDLVVLRRWVLDRLPHLAVTSFEMSAAEWERWSQQWGHTDTDQPADLTGRTEEHLVAESAEDLGEWVYPGDTRYPADSTGLDNDIDVDPDDGALWLPLPAMDTVAAMLTGHTTRFWAESYGSNPFAPTPYWGQASTFAAQGPTSRTRPATSTPTPGMWRSRSPGCTGSPPATKPRSTAGGTPEGGNRLGMRWAAAAPASARVSSHQQPAPRQQRRPRASHPPGRHARYAAAPHPIVHSGGIR